MATYDGLGRVNNDERVSKVRARYEQLKAEKYRWLPTWQMVGIFVQPSMQFIMGREPQGQIMTSRMYDSTAPKSAQRAASSIIGAVWPSGPRTFRIGPPDDMPTEVAKSQIIKDWYEYVSKRMYSVLDDPKCGLTTAINEYMVDQLTIGTSGIFEEENFGPDARERPVRFYPLDCKRVCIAEGPDGFVDTVYIERHYTHKQIVQEYGIQNVSKQVREVFLDNTIARDPYVKVLHAIEPRIDGVNGLFGNRNFPVASIHIELDSLHILKESGYEEMPAFVTRFWKWMNEVYGRSPATENMPDIIEVNQLREAYIVAVEKHLNPPIILNNDGSFGGGVFDTSASAVNIREASGRMQENGKMVEQIYDTGPVQETETRIEQLQQTIEKAYFIDQLTDLGNDSRMTLGEANMRNEMRGQALNTTYARQIAEMFNRIVMRTFHIMLGKDMFGYVRNSQEWNYIYSTTGVAPMTIPDEVAQRMQSGQHSYKVNFVSPAIRIMQNEQVKGMDAVINAAKEVGPIYPQALNVINWERFFREYIFLGGAPSEILNTIEEMNALNQSQQQAQAQQASDAQAEQHSVTAKHYGQAAKSAADAGLNPLALIQGGQNAA